MKAQAALAGIRSADAIAREFDWTLLASGVKRGDVVVSMLPASMHLRAAELALRTVRILLLRVTFLKEMAALDEQARAGGLCFVNECGLDPGLDHLFAHALLDAIGRVMYLTPENTISFIPTVAVFRLRQTNSPTSFPGHRWVY